LIKCKNIIDQNETGSSKVIYTHIQNQKQKGTCSHSSKIQGDNYLEREPKVSHRLAKEPRIQQVPKITNQKEYQPKENPTADAICS
jgi:hypothetical protein